MKKLLLLILVILSGSLLFLFKGTVLPAADNGQKITPALTAPTGVIIPDGWRTHDRKDLGIRFAAPDDFRVETNGDRSFLILPPENNELNIGNARFLYVSVVPNNLKNDETGQIYNYSASFHEKLLEMKIGETKNLSENEGQKDWYNYERLPDEKINGKTAKVFINRKPWEFPEGTIEYRYIVDFPEKVVIAGGYTDDTETNSRITASRLREFLNTFVFKK